MINHNADFSGLACLHLLVVVTSSIGFLTSLLRDSRHSHTGVCTALQEGTATRWDPHERLRSPGACQPSLQANRSAMHTSQVLLCTRPKKPFYINTPARRAWASTHRPSQPIFFGQGQGFFTGDSGRSGYRPVVLFPVSIFFPITRPVCATGQERLPRQ
jgi:hypothetical protein